MSPTPWHTYAFALAFALITPHLLFSQQPVFIPKKVAAKKESSLDSNGWRSHGMFILNINQSARSDWSGGGENFLLGINGILIKTIHHRKNKYTFDAYADVEMGMVHASSFRKFRKTTDRFDLTGEIEHRIGTRGHFNYALLGNINTQVFGGHNYFDEGAPKISSFLSPGKFLLSFGIDYKAESEKSYLSVFVSPVTVRWVTKIDEEFYAFSKYGVDSFHRVNTEIGAYISVHYSKALSKTSGLSSRLDLFSNYKRNPKHIDVLFNNVVNINISKFFAATFMIDIVYDHDIKKRTQIQEITGLGLRVVL